MKPVPVMPISRHSCCRCRCRAERGVVLVLTLILLVVISLLSVTTMRNVGSAEITASNVRTTELATQSAEIALRHCEASVLEVMVGKAEKANGTGPSSTYQTTFTSANVLPAKEAPELPRWQDQTNWDSASNTVFVVPLSLLNQADMAITTYKRPAECMVEQLPVVPGDDPVSFFVITARGFGPEVPAVVGPVRPRPVGSEVWLQSVIKLGAA